MEWSNRDSKGKSEVPSQSLIVLQILLDAGASKTVVNMFGHTPFDFICRGKTSECSDTTRTYLETLLRP